MREAVGSALGAGARTHLQANETVTTTPFFCRQQSRRLPIARTVAHPYSHSEAGTDFARLRDTDSGDKKGIMHPVPAVLETPNA